MGIQAIAKVWEGYQERKTSRFYTKASRQSFQAL